jgi:cysteine desulfurase
VTRNRIYLDHAATTPILPAAREAMVEALRQWHNPSSPHAEGRASRAALEDARARIASALDWGGRIIFTAGASEALTIVLQRARAGTRHISMVEHEALGRAAPEAVRLPVDSLGAVDLGPVAGDRPLVAVQHANNETGVLQPLAEIGEEVRARGGLLLADCAQTAGKLPLPEADFIALSAHKFGGPPGIGALLVKKLEDLAPVGGQEEGYRYGTENVPAIVAMAVALEAGSGWLADAARLRSRLEAAIMSGGGRVVAADSPRIASIGAYRMPGVSSQAQLVRFDLEGIAVSGGSACSSGSLKPGHVLPAMGWSEEAAAEVVRVSFGRSTNEAEVDRFVSMWTEMAARRRAA